ILRISTRSLIMVLAALVGAGPFQNYALAKTPDQIDIQSIQAKLPRGIRAEIVEHPHPISDETLREIQSEAAETLERQAREYEQQDVHAVKQKYAHDVPRQIQLLVYRQFLNALLETNASYQILAGTRKPFN